MEKIITQKWVNEILLDNDCMDIVETDITALIGKDVLTTVTELAKDNPTSEEYFNRKLCLFLLSHLLDEQGRTDLLTLVINKLIRPFRDALPNSSNLETLRNCATTYMATKTTREQQRSVLNALNNLMREDYVTLSSSVALTCMGYAIHHYAYAAMNINNHNQKDVYRCLFNAYLFDKSIGLEAIKWGVFLLNRK